MIYTNPFVSGDNITADFINKITANAVNDSDNIHSQYAVFDKYKKWARMDVNDYPGTVDSCDMTTNRYNVFLAYAANAMFCGDFIMLPDYLIGVPCRLRFKTISSYDNNTKYVLKVGNLGSLIIDEEATITTTERTITKDFTPDRSMSISLFLNDTVMPTGTYGEIKDVEFIPQNEDL